MFKVEQNVIFLLIGRLVQSLMSILTIRLMTELLSSAEVGHQYLITSLLLWFSLVLINPVGMYINRHLHEWQRDGTLFRFISQINRYFFLVAFVSIPVIYFLKVNFAVGSFLSTLELLPFVALYIYFSTWFQTLTSFFNFFGRQKTFVLINIFAQAMGISLAFFGARFVNNTAIIWMSGLLIGQVLGLILAWLLFLRSFSAAKSNSPKNSLFEKATLYFCYPIAITTLFMWFSTQGYRVLVEYQLGAEALASIGVGLGLAANLAGVIESVATQYFYPQYYAILPESDLQTRSVAWSELWKKTTSVYVPCAFLTVSVATLLVRVLTSANFHHVVYLVYFGAFIELFRQMSNITYLVSQGEKKTKLTIIPYFLGAACIGLALVVLIYLQMITVPLIAITLLVASIITFLFNLRVARKVISFQIEGTFIFKMLIFSLPLLISNFFVGPSDSVLFLFALAGISGGWTLFVILRLLSVSSRQ